ncbi:MAG: proline dehydrogenase family protein [Candidatus Micrarchaeota archaeon]|nr:proline dehydrogenase family protein [Candidatus Micrarchaeota archaeon]
MSILGEIGVLFARQWIAGTNASDALRVAKEINFGGKGVILNYLGENFTDKGQIEKSVKIYLELLGQIKKQKIGASVSVKPSQLGIMVGDDEFYRNYLKIVAYAKKLGLIVWVDAEEYEYIERTQKIALLVLKRYKNTGVAIQTRLRRSMGDAEGIAKAGGMIRLVKGAYAEPAEKAYVRPDEITGNYEKIMERLFAIGARLMVATHDDYLIYKAVSLEKKYRRRVMFGMLKGIRGRLADRLSNSGEEVQIYLPFGEEWFAYSLRRLKEEGHAMLLVRSIFQQ